MIPQKMKHFLEAALPPSGERSNRLRSKLNGSRPGGPAVEDNGRSHALAREAAFCCHREDAF